MSLYTKLLAVYQDVSYIQKDKRNSFHNYTYASEAAIKEELHQAFVKHGLVMLPPDVISIQDDKKTNEKGREEIITTLNVRFGIADVETGESITGSVCCRGVDNSDKGPYKALTGGLKYFLTTTFLIPTGDDPENEQGEKGSRKDQSKVLADKLIAGGMKPAEALQQAAKFEESTAPRPRASRPEMPTTSRASQTPPLRMSPVEEMVARIGLDKFKALAEFKRMKGELIELHGEDEGSMRYYDILNRHGVKKSDQFKFMKDALAAARDMQEEIIAGSSVTA